MKDLLARVWRNIGFICAGVVLIYLVVHAFDPPRLNWGDSGSDYNVMSSGRNFAKYGFLKLKLTPYLLDPARMTADDRALIYTHYPQLPDLMNGVLRVVFRLSDLVQFRFVALAFSFAAFFFIYQLIALYWSRQTAQVATALWVTNPIWIQHADYLHHAPYAAFFGFGSVYFLARYLRDGAQKFFWGSGIFLFLTYLASYDYWLFIPLLLAFVAMGHHRKVVSLPVIRVLGGLACFAVAALVFKFSTNMWVLGGWDAFMKDFRFQFAERATDTVTRNSWKGGVWDTSYGRVERFFSLLLFPIALFWAALPLLRKRYGDRYPMLATAQANPILLLAAALPFLCVFTEVWIGQYYPTLLLVPFYAVASAAAAVLLMNSTQRGAKVLAVALVVALLANSLDEGVRFKKSFFTRQDFNTLRAQIDSVSPTKQALLVNHVFDAQYRYFLERNMVALILNPPGRIEIALAYYSDPKHPRFATPDGAIFVQHKHLQEQLYDKGYYYIFSRYHLWKPWGNPNQFKPFIDSLITDRDAQLTAKVAQIGAKIRETDSYVIWRIRPLWTTPSQAGTP